MPCQTRLQWKKYFPLDLYLDVYYINYMARSYTKLVQMWVTPELDTILQAMCKHTGLNKTAFIRKLILEEHRRVQKEIRAAEKA